MRSHSSDPNRIRMLVLALIVLISLAGAGCKGAPEASGPTQAPAEATSPPAQESTDAVESATVEPPPEESTVEVYQVVSEGESGDSDTFELTGGLVTIKYGVRGPSSKPGAPAVSERVRWALYLVPKDAEKLGKPLVRVKNPADPQRDITVQPSPGEYYLHIKAGSCTSLVTVLEDR